VTAAIAWRPRAASPLEPVAAVALDEAAKRLCAALLSRTDGALGALRGVAGRALVVVTGDAGALPWVDGVVYVGRDPEAAALLVPTMLTTALPIALVERALLAVHAGAPLVVLPRPALVVPLAEARPLERRRLERWLETSS
jgi:hypothetical protein